RSLCADGNGPDDDAVAAYVAKYVTKGASETGAGTDHRLTTWSDVGAARVTDHVRALMRTCWRLGGLPEYEPLRLRAWAHTLGYRGHILTKSRTYSTTYAALRADRAEHIGHDSAPRDGYRWALALRRLRPHSGCRAHRRWHRRRPSHQSRDRTGRVDCREEGAGCLVRVTR
ncbi:replication initiator, partial [Streptomyces sp. GLT-R25]